MREFAGDPRPCPRPTDIFCRFGDGSGLADSSFRTGGRTTYTFDADGNQLTTQEPAGNIVTNTWTYENQLAQVELPDDTVITYTYAPVTRNSDELRLSRETNAGTTNYIWDAENIIRELDDTLDVEAEYTLAPMPYGDLVSQRRDADSTFYLFDALGSTRQLTDGTQTETDSYEYTAYGVSLGSTGSTPNNFQYIGELGYYKDEATAAYTLRRREYETAIARFLSEDPVQSDANMYPYADNSPTNGVDPSGLQPDGLIFPMLPMGGNTLRCHNPNAGGLDRCDFSHPLLQEYLNNYDWLGHTGYGPPTPPEIRERLRARQRFLDSLPQPPQLIEGMDYCAAADRAWELQFIQRLADAKDRAAARAVPPCCLDENVPGMGFDERFKWASTYATPKLSPELQEVLTAENLAIIGGVFSLFVLAQLTPAGWGADIILAILAIIGTVLAGMELARLLRLTYDFLNALNNAKTCADLDAAGLIFAEIIVLLGVDGILALVGGMTAKGIGKIKGKLGKGGSGKSGIAPASVKNFRGEPVRIPEGHIMSPRDPAMSAPPIIERGPFTTAQRQAMLQGGSGGTRLSPHHRHQIPTTHGGVIDELPGPGHPAGNVHTAGSPSRHPSPSVFNSLECGEALRSSEIRAHWQAKAQRMVEVESGVWIDPGL